VARWSASGGCKGKASLEVGLAYQLGPAGKECERRVDVFVGQSVPAGPGIAVVRPVFARKLVVETDHFVLGDVIVGRQKQERRRAAKRVDRLHGSPMGDDERVEREQAARCHESSEVAAVGKAEKKTTA